jgi:hypothetical protein
MVKPLFIAILLAVVACGIGYVVLNQMKETARKQQEEEAEAQYLRDLLCVHDSIVEASIKCVEMASGYSQRWRQAIEIDFDFNSSLQLQSSQYESDGSIATIERYKSEIDGLMSRLSEPPSRYRQAHSSLVDVYGVYAQLHSCGESPSGSLMSYNNKVNDLQSEFTKHMNKLKAFLPQQK